MTNKQFNDLHEALMTHKYASAKIEANGQTMTVKAWAGGANKRLYVTAENGKSLGWFAADWVWNHGHAQFSPSTSFKMADLTIDALYAEIFPAPVIVEIVEEADPAIVDEDAIIEAFFSTPTKGNVWRDVIECDGGNVVLLRDGDNGNRIVQIAASVSGANPEARLAQTAIEAAKTVTAIIVAAADRDDEVGVIAPADVEKGDAALALALELRDFVYEQLEVSGEDMDPETIKLMRELDDAVGHADAGWLVCRPS